MSNRTVTLDHHPPSLHGASLTLRPPLPRDIDDRLRCGRDAEFVRMCGGDARQVAPLTIEDARGWYARQRAEPHTWVIDLGGCCIGVARLHHLDRENARARYAIGIYDPNARGHGYGTEATRLVLRYAFDTLSLHRVDLRVLAFNQQGIACYEKCGFRREGIEREGAYIAGRWESDVIMSILEDEFRKLAPHGFASPHSAQLDAERSRTFPPHQASGDA